MLYDLHETFHALGEYRRAAMIAGRARAVAQECHADPLIRALSRDADQSAMPLPTAADGNDDTSVLSDAQRRVAVLAAAGYTNREIADKLYITVSTVEQHLTRTYRKLNIASRAELPATLEPGTTLPV